MDPLKPAPVAQPLNTPTIVLAWTTWFRDVVRLVNALVGWLAGGVAGFAFVSGGPGVDPGFTVALASGTYTPTLTLVANLSAATAFVCQWLRVGSVVTVSGRVEVDPIVAATPTMLGVSLPIASAFVNANGIECGGVGQSTVGTVIGFRADPVNDRAEARWTAGDLSNQGVAFSFTYQVI
jgi:hypothetical protein